MLRLETQSKLAYPIQQNFNFFLVITAQPASTIPVQQRQED